MSPRAFLTLAVLTVVAAIPARRGGGAERRGSTPVPPPPPAPLVPAYAADGAVLASVILGKASSSIGFNPLGGTFVREPDEAQSWLAEGQVTVPPYLSDWFDAIVHIPGPDIRRIT